MNRYGDFSANIAGFAKKKGIGTDEARSILENEMRIKAAGKGRISEENGYINLYLEREFVIKTIKEMAEEAVKTEMKTEHPDFLTEYAAARIKRETEKNAENKSTYERETYELAKETVVFYLTYEKAWGNPGNMEKDREKIAEKFYAYDRKTISETVPTELYRAMRLIFGKD